MLGQSTFGILFCSRREVCTLNKTLQQVHDQTGNMKAENTGNKLLILQLFSASIWEFLVGTDYVLIFTNKKTDGHTEAFL